MNNQLKHDDTHLFDEIDLLHLLKRSVARWRLYVIVAVLITLGTAIAAVFERYTAFSVSHQDLRLFGVHKGAYPNGVPFVEADFFLPEVMEVLAAKTGVECLVDDMCPDLLDMNRAYPGRHLLELVYAEKAKVIEGEKRDDTLADLQRLRDEFLEQIDKEFEDTYDLIVNHERYNISHVDAESLLREWPAAWQFVMNSNFRVNLNLTLVGSEFVDVSSFAKPQNVYYANDQINHLVMGLQVLSRDSRFQKMTSLSGRTPGEILLAIDEYKKVFFQPLYSSILSIETPLSKFYLSDQQLEIERLSEQIASLQSTIDDVLAVDVRTKTKPGPEPDGDIITIGDGTLNDIVGLVQKASMQDYLTTTLDRRHQLEVERSHLQKSLKQVSGNTLLTDEFVSSVSDIHQSLILEYNDLLGKARDYISAEHLEMYKLSSEPHVSKRPMPDMLIKVPLAAMGVIILLFVVFAFVPLKEEKT